MASIGDNSQLKSVVERIENVNEQISGLTADRSEIFKEAASNGLDVKILRKLISIRKQDKTKRDEAQAILESYMASLGMV
jgi:uncharacterized protein (UPF0335 family)